KIYADEIVSNQLTNQTTNQSITLEEIEELLRQSEQDQALLVDSSNWDINTATDSANLATVYSLQATELYVTEQAAINSLSVSETITVGADMVIQSAIDESSMANSINTLTAPLELQSLALAPIEMMAGMVRIDTNGDVFIEGNLYIAGKIEAERLTLRQSDEPITDELENGFANLLSLQDFEGNEVANITASGAAQFAQVITDRLVIARADDFLIPEISNGEITTNATAGQAIIPAGVNEIIINNPNVTDYTLVYVTPTSSTLNKVLYVKNKAPGYFIVGFNKALEIDVNFNWWVIDVRQ
ncbi:hypothetical protein KAT60_01535, partial [Candidatus Woesebacteria bacterium]|nr:hypothetical protein [Candidatus Woesebacteria bacterium]